MTIQKLVRAKKAVMKLWREMCIANGIGTDSKFVVFSPENPHAAAYNRAVGSYIHLRRFATSAQLDKLDMMDFRRVR